MRIPKTDPIEFLRERKFPGYRALRTLVPLSDPRSGVSHQQSDYNVKRLQHIDAYEKELRAKPSEELNKLFVAEQEKYRLERKAKEDEEERNRFFNQPSAEADFEHWSKATYWTLEEAVALSFGKDPKLVNWNKLGKLNLYSPSPFIEKYRKVRDLVLRAKNWNQLYDPVLPSLYLAWAKRNDIEAQSELVEAIEARGVLIADWKNLYDDLKIAFEKLSAVQKTTVEQRNTLLAENQKLRQEVTAAANSEKKSLPESERDSLLKMVLGMAIDAYSYDVAQKRNTATGGQRASISAALERLDLTLDPDTIRKFIKEAEERFVDLLPSPDKN